MERTLLSSGLILILSAAPSPAADESTSAAASDAAVSASSQPSETSEAPANTKNAQPPFFRLDYSGDFLTSPALTGDWGGERTKLAENGISFNVETLNYGQGNAHGGKSTNDAINYGGSTDYYLQFDTYRMGLWPGGYIKVRGETRWGHGIDHSVDAFSPPNFDALLPTPEPDGSTTLTEYYFMQFLSKKFGIIAGQVDLTRLPGQNVFFTDPYNQFMNTALWQNLAALAAVPYGTMTAGFLYEPTKWLSGATLAVDSGGWCNYSGFETAFHAPTDVSIIQSLAFTIKPFDLDGHQRFNFAYNTRKQVEMDQLGRYALSGVLAPNPDRRLNFPRPAIVGDRKWRLPHPLLREAVSRAIEPTPTNSDNWAFWYDFDQYLYQCPDDPTQGFGLFGGFGLTTGELFPVSQQYLFGLGGKGVIEGRPADRYGVGYYCTNFSNDIPSFLGYNEEQGVELFYNIEVTPWMHISPDLQFITHPGGLHSREVAIVYGLRMQVSF